MKAVAQRACALSGCGGAVIARGLCFKHYQRERRAGRLTPIPHTRRVCQICGSGHTAHGLCFYHWKVRRRTGVAASVKEARDVVRRLAALADAPDVAELASILKLAKAMCS